MDHDEFPGRAKFFARSAARVRSASFGEAASSALSIRDTHDTRVRNGKMSLYQGKRGCGHRKEGSEQHRLRRVMLRAAMCRDVCTDGSKLCPPEGLGMAFLYPWPSDARPQKSSG